MKRKFGSVASYKIIQRLEDNGYETVFVGGAVRDYVLGKPAKDIDIATSAEPDEVKALFQNTVDIGIAHGTVLVIVDGEPIEVTTFRTEGAYTDHRRPDEVLFVKSLREDLLRRDFTINALAMRKDGQLVDLFGGQKDLQEKVIRAVGRPMDRFREDALRMVRAVRFSAVLDFDIEVETFQAIQAYASQISHVSVERLKIEMDKIFVGINPVKAFTYLATSHLGSAIPLFPKNIAMLPQCVPFHTSDEGWAFMMIAGDFTPDELAQAYKLSNRERKFILAVSQAFTARKNRQFSIVDYYTYDVAILQIVEQLFRSFYPDRPTITAQAIEVKKNTLPIQSIQDLVIDGSDLIKWTGLKGGRWTGEWLKDIEDAVLYGLCENNRITIKDWFMNEFERKG